MAIPRRDWSSERFFLVGGGAGDLRTHQNTALIGVGGVIGNKTERGDGDVEAMLTIGMVMLALVTFAAMLGFVALCERV